MVQKWHVVKRENFQKKYDKLVWETGKEADEHFIRWKEGKTGKNVQEVKGRLKCTARPEFTD